MNGKLFMIKSTAKNSLKFKVSASYKPVCHVKISTV